MVTGHPLHADEQWSLIELPLPQHKPEGPVKTAIASIVPEKKLPPAEKLDPSHRQSSSASNPSSPPTCNAGLLPSS